MSNTIIKAKIYEQFQQKIKVKIAWMEEILEYNNCKYVLLGVETIEDAETVIKHFDELNKTKIIAKVLFKK